MRPWIQWMTVPALIASPAYAVQYLTVEEAQTVLFPVGTQFSPQAIELDEGRRRAIEEASGQRVREHKPQIWKATAAGKSTGWFFVDHVIGKHEFITYALALDTEGVVLGLEVLDYRETYGGEIRAADWRRQFAGKRQGDALKLGNDVRNISGATLSCRNVTNGVKRLLATHALLLK